VSLARYEVAIPPIAEQRRIVAAIERLLEKVASARERLERVPLTLKRFRQAVLAAACSGRLTADWRTSHSGRVPAVESIATTLNGMRKRIFDRTELPSIPESWSWIALPETGELNRGRSRNRPRNAPHLYGGAYPFIQTGDIANSGGLITTHTQTYSEAGLEQSRLWPAGTVCITIAANIADSAILSYPACFPDSVVGARPNPKISSPEYLEFFMRTARDNLAAFAPATAQANINLAILGELAVPIPPLEEQQVIVCRVSSFLALANTIEQRAKSALQRVEMLTQSILAKAFRGELVPTEAELAQREGRGYEPASELLARLKRATDDRPKSTRSRKASKGPIASEGRLPGFTDG
jgi:type I restriction enzyme S subunit